MTNQGRFQASEILDEEIADLVDELFSVTKPIRPWLAGKVLPSRQDVNTTPSPVPLNQTLDSTPSLLDGLHDHDLALIDQASDALQARRISYSFQDEFESGRGQSDLIDSPPSTITTVEVPPERVDEILIESPAWSGGESASDEAVELPNSISETELEEEWEFGTGKASPVSSEDDEFWFQHDAGEFDPEPDHQDLGQVETGGAVSAQDRAFQVAQALGNKYGWDRSGIRILAGLFEIHRSNPARAAIERLMADDLMPDELILAEQVRELWAECVEFHTCGVREGSARCAPAVYPTLGWPAALDVVRAFGSYPDADEIRCTLSELLDNWLEVPALQREFPSFLNYLTHCTRACRRPDLFSVLADRQYEMMERDWDRDDDLNVRREVDRLCGGGLLAGIV